MDKMEINKDITPYVTCPKCHARIYYLIETERLYVTFDVIPDSQGNLHYDVAYIDPHSDSEGDYHCPKCDAVLAKNGDEAIALFQKSDAKKEASK